MDKEGSEKVVLAVAPVGSKLEMADRAVGGPASPPPLDGRCMGALPPLNGRGDLAREVQLEEEHANAAALVELHDGPSLIAEMRAILESMEDERVVSVNHRKSSSAIKSGRRHLRRRTSKCLPRPTTTRPTALVRV